VDTTTVACSLSLFLSPLPHIHIGLISTSERMKRLPSLIHI